MNTDRRHALSSSLFWTILVLLAFSRPVVLAESAVLFENVRIFDGVDPGLTAGHVLVVGDEIAQVSTLPIPPPAGARVIDGDGRVLSPGFIDLHAHITLSMPKDKLFVHPWVVGAFAGKAAESYLNNGFTTIRDAGGTHPDLARAVNAGLLTGPRIFPSGAIVTQTSGHGDFRLRHDPHPTLGCGEDHTLANGLSVIADGAAQTLAAVRENLKHGATQIKIMGGGGVASDYDPIHTLQPSPEEIRAAGRHHRARSATREPGLGDEEWGHLQRRDREVVLVTIEPGLAGEADWVILL